MSETIPHSRQQDHSVQSSFTDKAIFFKEEESKEETIDMSPDQSYALFMKTFAAILKTTGLRSPQYYQDKSQCTSFADIKPVDRACVKAANLKSGYIEPTYLIERLRKLKPSDSFELREYDHPYLSWIRSPLYHEYPPDLKELAPRWVFKKKCELSRLLGRGPARPFEVWLKEHWKKIELSLNDTSTRLAFTEEYCIKPEWYPLPRYLIFGLHSLCD